MERGESIMGSEMKPVYFFHIPKTSGRFFVVNTVLIVEHEFLIRGIDYGPHLKGFGHLSFKPLDTEDITAFTFLREPVSRTVSHYLHILNNQLTDDIQYDKSKFIRFLHENPTHSIIDYQTKYIISSGSEEVIDIYDESCFSENLGDADLDFAKTRLSKVDFIFDVNQQGETLARKVIDLMYQHFNFTPSDDVKTLNLQYPPIMNPQSKILYDSLTSQEKLEIESLMVNDMNLYNSTTFSQII